MTEFLDDPAIRWVSHSSHWGAFDAGVRDGRLVGVRPFRHDLHPSPLTGAIPDAVHAGSRITTPAVRRGFLERGAASREARGRDEFVAVGWDEALDLVAAELERVRSAHGNEAIFGGSYGWSSAGRFHHAKTQLNRFLNTTGGFVGQIQNYSIAAGLTLLPHLLGSTQACSGPLTGWGSIARNSGLVVAFGGVPDKNLQVAAGGPAEHAAPSGLRAARAAGVEFVNISPLRSDIDAEIDAEWIAPRPNTDTALMLGIAHTLLAENLHDRAFLERYCVGYARFEAYLAGRTDGTEKDAVWAAAICGIDPATIRALARRMAATRTMITMTWSLQRADHGEQPFWMAITLAAMLGQIGLPGGGIAFGHGSISGMGTPRTEIASPNLSAGANPVETAIPVARISDMLLHPGAAYDFNGRTCHYPDIRLVYWAGGNPFHHHQDINRMRTALRRPETFIVHESWWTATARFADIVLPATTTLERNDVGACGRDRFIIAMKQALEPLHEARNDHDIFRGLAERMGTLQDFTEGRSEMGWVRHLYETAREQASRRQVQLPDFDSFWERGFAEIEPPAADFDLFADFRADPEGSRLKTPSGRIEIYSETIAGFGYDDCPGHATWLEPAEWLGSPHSRTYPLHMISNQPRNRLHGQLDDTALSRSGKVGGREPLLINPADAGARQLADGDIVRVFNARGSVLAGVRITDTIRPGVVQLATGSWYDPADPSRDGSTDKHGNPNVLTLDKGTSRLGQGPIAQTALVEVERAADAPPVTAYDPPKIARGVTP